MRAFEQLKCQKVLTQFITVEGTIEIDVNDSDNQSVMYLIIICDLVNEAGKPFLDMLLANRICQAEID